MSTKFFFAALYFGLPCSFLSASAQNATNDSTKRVSQKKITLGKDTLVSSSDQTLYISGITVVNALWDASQLGYVQLGSFNRKVVAVPDKSMGTYLQDDVNSAFGNLYQPGKAQLLWVIQDLRIGERTVGMTERAFVHLKATAYVSVSGSAYKELRAINIEHFNSGWDVTHKHPNNIASAFKELYLHTIAANDTTGAAAPVISYDAVVAKYQLTGAVGGALLYSQGELPLAEEFPKMLYKPEATAIDMETGTFIF